MRNFRDTNDGLRNRMQAEKKTIKILEKILVMLLLSAMTVAPEQDWLAR